MIDAIPTTRPTSAALRDIDRQRTDRRLVEYVGRHGAVSIAHVMFGVGLRRTTAYDRVAALIDAGLLERLELLRGEPALLRATRAGLRYARLGMAPAVVSPGSVGHWLRCASVALGLEAGHGSRRIVTDRELAFAERHEERPVASARIGELPDGRPRLHRPDLVILPEGHPLIRLHNGEGGPDSSSPAGSRPPGYPGGRDWRTEDDSLGRSLAAHPRTLQRGREIAGYPGPALAEAEEVRADSEDMRVICVEVELTPKSPKRLREIVRAWRRASWVDEVRYLCEPGQTRRAVERAVAANHAEAKVLVSELGR